MSIIEELKNITVGRLSAIREFFVGKSLNSLGTPIENEIYSLANVNNKIPRLLSYLVEMEEQLNQLVGVIEATGEPLFPRYDFFARQADRFLRLTPSVQQKRAEMLAEILQGNALAPTQQKGAVLDMGDDEVLSQPSEGGKY